MILNSIVYKITFLNYCRIEIFCKSHRISPLQQLMCYFFTVYTYITILYTSQIGAIQTICWQILFRHNSHSVQFRIYKQFQLKIYKYSLPIDETKYIIDSYRLMFDILIRSEEQDEFILFCQIIPVEFILFFKPSQCTMHNMQLAWQGM